MSGHGAPWPVRRGLYRNTTWWEIVRSKNKRHRDLLVSMKVVDIYVLENTLLSGKRPQNGSWRALSSYLFNLEDHFPPYIAKGLCWEGYSSLFSSHRAWNLNRKIIACLQSPFSPQPFRTYLELMLLCVWLPWLSKYQLTSANRWGKQVISVLIDELCVTQLRKGACCLFCRNRDHWRQVK
jgi:hypothetical protein